MKCILLSDTHLGVHKSSPIWQNTTIKLFKSIIDDCERRNITTIFHLGDWFDDRKNLNITTLDVSKTIAHLLKNLEVNIIIGNHDTYYKDRTLPSSLLFYEKHENINVFFEPTQYEDILLVPWNTLTHDILGHGGKYMFGHLEINTFNTNDSYCFSKSVFNPDNFKKFDLVLSGHFHTPSKKNNIQYIGSPFHQTFNDVGSTRGYYIFDDGEIEFIPFNDSPKFVVMTTESDINKNIIEGNIIKLKFLKDYGTSENSAIISSIQQHNPLQLHSDFSNITISNKDVVQEEVENLKLKNHREIFYEYIDSIAIPEHLKRSTLKALINQILKPEE